jgi:amidase
MTKGGVLPDVVAWDAVSLAAAIESKRLSSREVMSAYLNHIEKLNPRVNAIVSLRDRSALLAEADARDHQLARGEHLGWMHGFPIAVKDLAAVAGLPMTRGFAPLRKFIPDNDDIFVARLKAAGAIVIGKTNTPEFGLGSHTYNKVFGTTLNAYDQSKSAGGSSGGAAVALALRMLPVADGGDHAGSLRNPAAFNNVFGFRPSFGRVPSDDGIFQASLSVLGPMARTVPDLAMLLSVMSGYDARAPLSLSDDPAIFRQNLDRDFKGTRIGWLGDFGGRLPFESGVLDLCLGALQVFEQLGCVVEDALPRYPIEHVWTNWLILRAWGVRSRLKEVYDNLGMRLLMKPEAQWEVERAANLSIDDISRALDERAAYYRAVRDLFERYDVLIAPSAQIFPFDAKLDWPKEVGGRVMDTYHRWMEVCVLVTMSGCPALGTPVGFNGGGLPMGVQIIAPHRGEFACLQLAHAYDQATRWVEKRKPALLS